MAFQALHQFRALQSTLPVHIKLIILFILVEICSITISDGIFFFHIVTEGGIYLTGTNKYRVSRFHNFSEIPV